LFKKSVCLFLFFIALGFFSGLVYAVEVVRVDKSKNRLTIAPGQSKIGDIMVENPTDESKIVHVYLEDWYYVPPFDGAKEFKPTGTTKLSAAGWITFSPSELVLLPFGKQKINYTVKVPPEATGGHYAVLFFESLISQPISEADLKTENVGVNLAVRLASLFYIEAEGTLKKDVSLINLFATRVSEDKPLNLGLEIKNNGNVDMTAGGNFNIIDKKGMVYSRGEFNNVYTFPGDSGKLSASWSLPIPKGTYDLVITLDLGKAQEELNLGRGQTLVKETEIEIGNNGEVTRIGELK
jgi:hypothetical protein